MSFKTQAQNLVPNPGFEIHSSCPDGSTWPNELNKATPWYNPNTASPDFMDTCSHTGFGVPYNAYGYQWPRTGSAYAGLYSCSNGSSVRDYAQVQLLDTLQGGHSYCVSFFLALAVNNSCSLAITRMGMLFTQNTLLSSGSTNFTSIPQITSPPGVFLSDTLNWMQVTGSYTATGGEHYITIGNFFDDSNTDTMSISSGGSGTKQAYYYLDDVSIVDCTNSISENLNETYVNIFPNPNSGEFTIQINLEGKKDRLFEIMDVHGEIMRREIISDSKFTLVDQKFQAGVYYYRILENSKKVKTGKIVVIK